MHYRKARRTGHCRGDLPQLLRPRQPLITALTALPTPNALKAHTGLLHLAQVNGETTSGPQDSYTRPLTADLPDTETSTGRSQMRKQGYTSQIKTGKTPGNGQQERRQAAPGTELKTLVISGSINSGE